MQKITSLFFTFAIIGAVYGAPTSDADDADRILNGKSAKLFQYPFVVSLQYKMPSDEDTLLRSKFCGGSIINKDWILTAAHCIYTLDSKGEMHINAGVTNAFDQTGQYPKVAKIIHHPEYNKTGEEEHDIALLKLESPLGFGPAVQPITLPPPDFKPSGVGTIIGWGAINADHSKSSNRLLETPIPVSPSKDCDIFRGHRPAQHICLGGKGGGSACAGDSGGPFILTYKGKPTVAGVTSFGTVECTANEPVVYTNVAAYRSWLDSVIAKN